MTSLHPIELSICELRVKMRTAGTEPMPLLDTPVPILMLKVRSIGPGLYRSKNFEELLVLLIRLLL